MARMYATAGCKIYIGGAAIADPDTDMVVGDFSAVTWTQVKGWTQMGQVGDTAALVTSDQIDSQRTKKAKGTRNAGSMENTFDVVADDAGQLALVAAEKTSNNYPIKIEYNDTPASGSTPTPSQSLFIALVMTSARQGSGANDPRRRAFTLEINSNIVFVAAATGD